MVLLYIEGMVTIPGNISWLLRKTALFNGNVAKNNLFSKIENKMSATALKVPDLTMKQLSLGWAIQRRRRNKTTLFALQRNSFASSDAAPFLHHRLYLPLSRSDFVPHSLLVLHRSGKHKQKRFDPWPLWYEGSFSTVFTVATLCTEGLLSSPIRYEWEHVTASVTYGSHSSKLELFIAHVGRWQLFSARTRNVGTCPLCCTDFSCISALWFSPRWCTGSGCGLLPPFAFSV